MPLRAKLTISEEPMIIEDDEVETLRSQGLLEGEPEPLAPPAPAPAQPRPAAAAAAETQKD